MNLYRIFAVALFVVVGGLSAYDRTAQGAELRPSVVVDSDVVTVGDMFADAGDAAAEPVFYAPDPGEQVEIGPNFLYRVALAHDLDWQPGTGADRILVLRAAQDVTYETIVASLTDALLARTELPLAQGQLRLELDSGITSIRLPTGVPADLMVEDVRYDVRSQRFSALLIAAPQTVHEIAVRLAGRVRAVSTVPVLVRSIARDQLITAEDVDFMEIAADRLPANALLAPDLVIGHVARVALRPGEPLSDNDVRPPRQVVRGEPVTMVYRSGALVITAQGQALENGALNDVIRVVNTQSSRTVDARVTGPGQVAVAGPIDTMGY